MTDRRDFLKSFALLTGSVAFGVATEKSDVDYLIPYDRAEEWESNYCDDLEEAGSLVDDDNIDQSEFHSWRDPVTKDNFIVALTADFESRWRAAHAECLVLQPKEKKDRIRIFRHHLYGEPIAAGGEG